MTIERDNSDGDESVPPQIRALLDHLSQIPMRQHLELDNYIRDMYQAPYVNVISQFNAMRMAPIMKVADQYRDMQTASVSRLTRLYQEMRSAPFQGLAAQIQQMNVSPYVELAQQLRVLQVVPYADVVKQLRAIGEPRSGLYGKAVDAILRNFESSSSVDEIIETFQPERFLESAGLQAPFDTDGAQLAEWFREMLSDLVVYGGPILVMQVLIILWAMADDLSPEVRTKFVELATLLALAISLAPAFRALGRRIAPPKDSTE